MHQARERYQSIMDATTRIKDQGSELLQSHLELLNEELSTQHSSLNKGVLLVLATGLCAIMAAVMGSLALVETLKTNWPNLSAAQIFAIVSAIWVLAAIILGALTKSAVSHFSIFPRATLNSLSKSLKCIMK